MALLFFDYSSTNPIFAFRARVAMPGARYSTKSKLRSEKSTTMAAKFGDAAAEAARLALKMGSAALDMITFMVDLGEEFPVAKPVLSTLKVIREKVETVKSNRNELTALEKRCTYITAGAIAKSRQNPSSEMNVAPLQDCLKAVENVVDLCGGRGSVSRVLKASSDKDEIAELNSRIDRLTGDLGLGGIATVEGKVDDMKATLVRLIRVSAGAVLNITRGYQMRSHLEARNFTIIVARRVNCLYVVVQAW